MIAILGLAALAGALFLRYEVIENSGIGIACETGEESFICAFRYAVIMIFARSLFGWIALISACIQLWRPNSVTFGTAVVFALLGLVLYNTRIAALAVGLLVLSLARPSLEAR